MNINRWLGLGLGVVLLAGCEYFVAAPPSTPTARSTPIAPSNSPIMPPGGSVSCSNVSIDATKQALRDVASYTYRATGYIDMWERFTGAHDDPLETPDTTIRRPTKSSGAYVAPDRLAQEYGLVNARDEILEARLQTGDEVWIRFVGSRRWLQRDVEPEPANPILAIVDQPLDWAIGGSDVMSGHCSLLGTSADGPVAWTVKLTAPVGSDMPTNVEVTRRIDQPPDWERPILQNDVYVLQPDDQVTIDPPVVDTGPATEADVLYHVERRGCWEPPCDVRGFELVYEAHNGALDLFGYERPGASGYVWFEEGLAITAGGGQACPSVWDFSFHSGDSPTDTLWIGGPLTAPETATLHVRQRDGQESEHAISAPAYIVPAGTVDESELVSFWIVGPDGDELFRYNEPSPETGVPPPSPPSPGC